ncbi:hypothetical protein ACRYI5_05715 [Furfurilactobacillus sp. WILCCON 0119]
MKANKVVLLISTSLVLALLGAQIQSVHADNDGQTTARVSFYETPESVKAAMGDGNVEIPGGTVATVQTSTTPAGHSFFSGRVVNGELPETGQKATVHAWIMIELIIMGLLAFAVWQNHRPDDDEIDEL